MKTKVKSVKIVLRKECYFLNDLILIETYFKKNSPGRPKISQKTIDQIKIMFFREYKSYRQIAEECHVSLGTVHKYVHQLKHMAK